MIRSSWTTILVTGQTILNASLAFWLFMEYLHNPFMQEYVANVWASIWPEVAVALSAVTVVLAYLLFYMKRHAFSVTDTPAREMGDTGSFAVLDTCPFCNIPLKVLSDGRFQCRQCRRYFKK